ncbi:C-type lectin domain family 4 member A [Sinocyclocheilus grahami]|uniref:C-type lectin domain family 4 member A n=1 Tax=Sinocyclocheilus grahami TaxID=75366 RepID=UPI0007AD4BD6|nr:PREDICTED: C-type lectin domain family 4 member A-like [Sinocyclocheilus grahami]
MCGAVILFMALLIIVSVKLQHQYSKVTEVENEVANLTSSLALLSSNQQDIYKPVLSCKAGWQPFLSNCYEFSSNKVSWQTARLYCSRQGTLLLILGNDSKEWDFIVQRTALSSESYWIGLTDAITGRWRWVDGTPYTMNSRHVHVQ